LGGNRIEGLTFSQAYSSLVQLDLSFNKNLIELDFENGLPNLIRLNLDGCALECLDFSKGFLALDFLQAVSNKLKEVKFKEAMPKLKYLDLSQNQIKKLNLPGGFDKLQYFYFRKNEVKSNITFKTPVPLQLNSVNLNNSNLQAIPEEIIFGENLEWLNLQGNVPKNIPKLFLEKENCLSDARDWFTELRGAPSEKNKVVKLMLTGNGDAGKTTLLCALKNGSCEHDHTSTHGIQIETWEDKTSVYNTWDFGGQEVYHGTHRLFMSSEAIQLILFTPNVQGKARKREKVFDRIRKDEILPYTVEYWYQTIKALSPNSTFLFTQNKEDLFPEKDKTVRDYADEMGAELRLISAKEGIGIKHLKNFLRTYAEDMPEYDMSMPESWLKVRQFFIDNVDSNNPKESIKIIDQTFFEKKCEEYKVSERTWGLLKRYLHHSGYIYYHEKLGDKIIADQKWALEAIYKPLDRNQEYYQELIDDQGKIRVRNLFDIFGKKYDKKQKWLFLQFLKSCGLCFKIKTRNDDREDNESDQYLFPEFLKEEREEEVDELWRKAENVQQLRYKLPWLNYHIIQNFITNVGRKTNTKYIWRTGIFVPTKHGMFRVELDASGEAIILSIEQKAVEPLLNPIVETMGNYTDRDKWEILIDGAFQPFSREKGIPFLRKDKLENKDISITNEAALIGEGAEGKIKGTDLSIIEDKIQEYKGNDIPIYFSYAWRDEKNPQREVLVQQMYDSLGKANFKIQRDKEDCGHGEYIDEFMKDIGRGELILVFLSEKYLRSVYCMSELYNISKECGSDKSRFKDKILPIVVEPVDFSDQALFKLLDYWEALGAEKETYKKEHAHRFSGPTKLEEWNTIISVSQEVNKLVPWLAKMNRGSIKLYQENDFANIKRIIKERLANTQKLKNNPQVIAALENSINQLNIQLIEIKGAVIESKEVIIGKIDSMEAKILDSLGDISVEFKNGLQDIFQKINQRQIKESTIKELNEELVEKMTANLNSLPENIAMQWKDIQDAEKDFADVKGKFKWNIAVIPGILKYETEVTKTIPVFKWARKYWSNVKLKTENK